MKIEAITLREVQMPLVHFFETSFGRIYSRRILLVSVEGDGLRGWGECVAGEDPFYSSEWIDSAWPTITRYLAPVLAGKTLSQGREAAVAFGKGSGSSHGESRSRECRVGCGGAREEAAAVEVAGRNAARDSLRGVDRNSGFARAVARQRSRRRLAAGYRRIKLKVKPGWDVNVLEKVRSRWSDITLSVDANSAYTLDEFEHLRKFDQFNLLMIEQPLWNDDVYYHARLQKELRTPICLDESIESARDAACAVETGACRIINIKVGRVGGFSEAKKVHDVCQANRVPVWCGGMLETGIGRSHNIALSTLENFSLPGDVSASKRYWKEDVIEPEVEVSREGMISLKDDAGTGYRVREDLIEKLTVKKEVVRKN